MFKKLFFFVLLITLPLFATNIKEMTVYKSPYCGCCTKWVDIMKSNGIDATEVKLNNVNIIKAKVGITPKLASCHTAMIDGYVVEGHVPYSAVEKMLKEKPDIIGLTVPGMPIGSPGMEQGDRKDPYNVYAIHKDGKITIYEKH